MIEKCPKCGGYVSTIKFYGNHFGEDDPKTRQWFELQGTVICSQCHTFLKPEVVTIYRELILGGKQ